jgi:hypothetical protein
MPTPSGVSWSYISTVSDTEYEEASASLDRALLAAIGLPEDMEMREIENELYALSEKVKAIVEDFSVAKLIGILPDLIIDAAALWEKVEPSLATGTDRKDFITKIVRYAYRKNNPDIPFIPEPFETVIEDMIIGAIPTLLDTLEAKFEEITDKLKEIFTG